MLPVQERAPQGSKWQKLIGPDVLFPASAGSFRYLHNARGYQDHHNRTAWTLRKHAGVTHGKAVSKCASSASPARNEASPAPWCPQPDRNGTESEWLETIPVIFFDPKRLPSLLMHFNSPSLSVKDSISNGIQISKWGSQVGWCLLVAVINLMLAVKWSQLKNHEELENTTIV